MSFYTSVHANYDSILLRGVDKVGKRFAKKVSYKPTLYLPSQKESKYRTIRGEYVEPLPFESMMEARGFIKKYKDVEGFNIYGSTNFQYTFIHENYPGLIKYDPSKINVLSFDIEVISDKGFPYADQAIHEVVAISMRMRDKMIVLGCQPYKVKADNVTYILCKDEAELLEKFLQVWKDCDPDIVTGWNISGFDIPYMVNRLERILGDGASKRLSPWGLVETRSVFIRGKEQNFYFPVGVAVLDYLELFRKFTFKEHESYKLDYIAFQELGDRKIDYSEYETLQGLYYKNYDLFIDYNIKDTDIVFRLDEKMKFIEQAMAIAFLAKINLTDVFTSVRMWDVIIHNYLKDKNIIVPPMTHQIKTDQIIGAYVKDPIPNLYKWVVSFDVNSLYPMLIIMYNISPEKLTTAKHMMQYSVDEIVNGSFAKDTSIQTLLKSNKCIAGNGVVYNRDGMGFLPALMDEFYQGRVVYKKKMIEAKQNKESATTEAEKKKWEKEAVQMHNIQLALKIILNSAYGSLSNVYFRYFDVKLAESVTVSGQMGLKWVEKAMNQYLNSTLETKDVDYIIAIDTDSMYISLDNLVNKVMPNEKDQNKIIEFVDSVCKKALEPQINKSFDSLAAYTNAMSQKLVMKREVIANKGIWIAKKRYILNVHDSEGVRFATPEIKMMGVEAIRTNTPYICRGKIKEAFKLMMNKEEEDLQNLIKEFREEWKSLPFEEVSKPSGCNGMEEYADRDSIFKKGTPMHVKGALIYNNLLKQHGLQNTFAEVNNGDKIRVCYLKLPNPAQSPVISAPGMLPKQFGLDKYIDYDTQFEKAFLDPVSKISAIMGWSAEARATLADLWD